MFNARRVLLTAGLAALLLVSGGFTLTPASSPALAVLRSSSVNGGCQGMDKVEATERFRHLDGSPSRFSEWRYTDIGLAHEGPVVRGRVPAGNFFVYGRSLRDPERWFTLEGAIMKGRRFEVICTPDLGVGHVQYPFMPRHCPATVKEAIRQIGGRKDGKGWSQGVVEPFSGVSSILGYYRRSSRKSLGTFTVPFQTQVIVREREDQFDVYGPGDSVPSSYRFAIYCYI